MENYTVGGASRSRLPAARDGGRQERDEERGLVARRQGEDERPQEDGHVEDGPHAGQHALRVRRGERGEGVVQVQVRERGQVDLGQLEGREVELGQLEGRDVRLNHYWLRRRRRRLLGLGQRQRQHGGNQECAERRRGRGLRGELPVGVRGPQRLGGLDRCRHGRGRGGDARRAGRRRRLLGRGLNGGRRRGVCFCHGGRGGRVGLVQSLHGRGAPLRDDGDLAQCL